MPDNFKIKFRALLPMEGEAIENGELLIEQGFVKEIRSTQSPATDRCLDLSDHLILPGFVNAHCHLSLSALRGKVPKCEKFTDWVRALLKENLQTPWRRSRTGPSFGSPGNVAVRGDDACGYFV